MKAPKIFYNKKDPRYWDNYWQRSRQIPPRDPYLYYGRTISDKEIDRYLDKMSLKYTIETALASVKNFIKNIFKTNKEK